MPAASQQHTIPVSIPSASVKELESALKAEFPETTVELAGSRPALARNEPLRQVEIVDLLIHCVTVVALEEVLRFLKEKFASLVVRNRPSPRDGDGE